MYSLLERLSPGTRKLEIFARPHNVQPGWVCLGNQLDGTKIADPEMLAAYTKRMATQQHPSGNCLTRKTESVWSIQTKVTAQVQGHRDFSRDRCLRVSAANTEIVLWAVRLRLQDFNQ